MKFAKGIATHLFDINRICFAFLLSIDCRAVFTFPFFHISISYHVNTLICVPEVCMQNIVSIHTQTHTHIKNDFRVRFCSQQNRIFFPYHLHFVLSLLLSRMSSCRTHSHSTKNSFRISVAQLQRILSQATHLCIMYMFYYLKTFYYFLFVQLFFTIVCFRVDSLISFWFKFATLTNDLNLCEKCRNLALSCFAMFTTLF